MVFSEESTAAAFLLRARREGIRDFGACMAPFTAFQILQGMPKEGAVLAVDNMVIQKSAPRPDLALKFMNFMLEGKNSAELTNLIGSGDVVVTAHTELRLEHALALPVFFGVQGRAFGHLDGSLRRPNCHVFAHVGHCSCNLAHGLCHGLLAFPCDWVVCRPCWRLILGGYALRGTLVSF
jgi:hypothetical protein